MTYQRILLLISAYVISVAALAETAFVTDQLTVGLRADATPSSAAIKTVTTGTILEIIERAPGVAHVRDPQGAEGWVDASALSTQPPAGVQAKSLKAELERTRAQLVQAQTQLDKSRTAGTGPVPAEVEQLQTELAAVKAQLVQSQAELKKSSERASQETPVAREPADPERAVSGGKFSFLWLGIAFAMLVLGFVGGVVWVRESIRRRMGGLYLRI